MAEKQYLILLDIDARKRHHHVTEVHKVIQFTVQLEIKAGEKWKSIVRYDYAHNYAHKDCYNIKGDCRKMKLYLSYEDAMTLADDDINENWIIYKDRFFKGDFP